MKQEKRHQPYRQGHLDCLCGVYAVVNAVKRLCGPIDDEEATELFNALLTFLEKHDLLQACTWGVIQGQVTRLLNQVVCKQYPILKHKPYRCARNLSLDAYWKSVQQFIDTEHGVVLTGIGGYHDHWTLIDRVTEHNFILYDSSGIRRLNRRQCALSSSPPGNHRHILYPIQTYFLWVNTP